MKVEEHPRTPATAEPRINLPINLENWRHLDAAISDQLLWFHQHLIDEAMGWNAAAQALGYTGEQTSNGTLAISSALRGTMSDYEDLLERIQSYRKVVRERSGIIKTDFAENPIAQLIWAGLDYAVANNSITLIEGDSGHGKTLCTGVWAKMDVNNHGKTVMTEANAVGGTQAFLAEICSSVRIGVAHKSITMMRAEIFRAFNANRMLIIDEATRLLPRSNRGTPEKLEFLRELHDKTGCALALLATSRLGQELNGGTYIFEQVLGRIGMPIRLPSLLTEEHFRPIVVQYFPKPSKALLTSCGQVANNKLPRQQGRLRLLSQVLRLASRIASKKKTKLVEVHFYEALASREAMMGDILQRKEAA